MRLRPRNTETIVIRERYLSHNPEAEVGQFHAREASLAGLNKDSINEEEANEMGRQAFTLVASQRSSDVMTRKPGPTVAL